MVLAELVAGSFHASKMTFGYAFRSLAIDVQKLVQYACSVRPVLAR